MIKRCPTPTKLRFANPPEAYKALYRTRDKHKHEQSKIVYLCRCSWYHWGHKKIMLKPLDSDP